MSLFIIKGTGTGTQAGRNLEARADAEAMEGAAYCFAPHFFLSLLSYRTKDHQSRDGTTHNRLDPHTHIYH